MIGLDIELLEHQITQSKGVFKKVYSEEKIEVNV